MTAGENLRRRGGRENVPQTKRPKNKFMLLNNDKTRRSEPGLVGLAFRCADVESRRRKSKHYPTTPGILRGPDAVLPLPVGIIRGVERTSSADSNPLSLAPPGSPHRVTPLSRLSRARV